MVRATGTNAAYFVLRLCDWRDTLSGPSRPVLQIYSGVNLALLGQHEVCPTGVECRALAPPRMVVGLDPTQVGNNNDFSSPAPYAIVMLFYPGIQRIVTVVFSGNYPANAPIITVTEQAAGTAGTPQDFDTWAAAGPGGQIFYQSPAGTVVTQDN